MKEKSISQGLEETHSRALKSQKSVLFSYSFRFDVRDVLPLLTHPADKNKIRVYWTQPSRGFSYAGLGSVVKYQQTDIRHLLEMKNQVLESMRMGVSLGDNSLIGPRMIGGFAFSQYKGSDSTWKHFPRAQFHLPECLATLTDDGAWLTISRLIQPDDNSENLSADYKRTIEYYKNFTNGNIILFFSLKALN